jgi:hypothetical protein
MSTTLSYEQKKAFHRTTQELLQQTEYTNIAVTLGKLRDEKTVIDNDIVGYIITCMFTVATEIRAVQLGMEMTDIRYTKEEMERKVMENFFGNPFEEE